MQAAQLDLHFSDTWADPGHQTKPAAWQNLDFEGLLVAVEAYCAEIVAQFQSAGVLPRWVQLGNEISAGMLWPDGRVGGDFDSPAQWEQ